MILPLLFVQIVGSLGQANIVDTTSMLTQNGEGTRVLSGPSRDLLKQFQLDLDDLSARMGATTFGRAESIDQKLFRSLRYVNRLFFCFNPTDVVSLKCRSMQVRQPRPLQKRLPQYSHRRRLCQPQLPNHDSYDGITNARRFDLLIQ
jgi:hypothetical protein